MSGAKYIDTEALSAYTEAIKNKLLSKIYGIKGSAIYADDDYLASPIDPAIDSVGLWKQVNGVWSKITTFQPGWIYNIANAFTTDENFINEGISLPTATNILVVNVATDINNEPILKFDILTVGIDLDAVNDNITTLSNVKQNIELTNQPDIIIPDHTVANATARVAMTAATVSNEDVVFQLDTEEYYCAIVDNNNISWYDIGNTKTVEGALKLLACVMPVKPISAAEIQSMFTPEP